MHKIKEAIESVLVFLRSVPLCNNTIKHYRSHLWGNIFPYCESNSIMSFSDAEMREYTKEQSLRVDNGEFCKSTMIHRRKAAALLADYTEGRELVWNHKSFKSQTLCKRFEEVLDDFSAYLSFTLAPRTIRDYIGKMRQFLVFAEQSGLGSLNKLSSKNVKDFLVSVIPKYQSSMSTLMVATRRFLSYLADTGIASVGNEWELINPSPRHRKLLPCFSDKETDAILNSVDRSTSIGKRDYAVIMLALWTGLRGVDILRLKRTDIDWNRKLVGLVQDKTEVCIQTRLPPGVGNAIADYILNGRPETDSPYIFVRHIRPYEKLSGFACRDIIARCFPKAGISHEAWDGKSFHAFRRTFGTRLVRAGVPITSVGDMLGHTDPNSAKRYVALDLDSLRICCLDISAFTTRKEGLL